MISSSIPQAFLIPSVFIIVKFTPIILAGDVSKNGSDSWTGVPYISKYSYASPVGLKSLFTLERTLYKSLSQHAAALKSSSFPQQLKLYLTDYEESTLKAINNTGKDDKKSIEDLSGNPILAFRTVWRFVKFLRRWAEPGVNMPKNQASRFKDISLLLAPHYNASDGPTSSDLEDAKMGLIRIVDTFTMDIQHFAAGNISGKDIGVGLTAAQCIEIAWSAENYQFHVTCVEFMEAALDKAEEEKGDISVTTSKARLSVKSAYSEHDASFDNATDWEIDIFTKPLNQVSDRTKRVRRRDVVSSNLDRKLYDEDLNQKYRLQTVCTGTYRQDSLESSKLFCWYEHQVDPTFKIGPLKVEFVAPRIVKFHRLIPEAAISRLKNNISTFREMRVSQQGRAMTVKDITSRLSAFTLLHPSQSSTARLIADLTGRAAGLQYNERNFETMHIAVYTPGGYYYCHPDRVPSPAEVYESRVATLLLYLSDVEQGGGTGFCKHGVVVEPEIGSALLWYNMLSSGLIDLASNHCSCPVVFGEKWVFSTWIYMGSQSQLQCDQDPSAKLEYLVNKKSAAEFTASLNLMHKDQ